MSDAGSNRPRSALADGAERMSVLARTAAEQQLVERGAIQFPVTDVYSTSPDEAWSRKFMSQGIGPAPDCTSPGGYCPIPFAMPVATSAAAPKPCVTAAVEPVRAAQLPLEREAPASMGHSQIGQAIGKPLKRSWFRRGSP